MQHAAAMIIMVSLSAQCQGRVGIECADKDFGRRAAKAALGDALCSSFLSNEEVIEDAESAVVVVRGVRAYTCGRRMRGRRQ